MREKVELADIAAQLEQFSGELNVVAVLLTTSRERVDQLIERLQALALEEAKHARKG